MKEVKDDIKKFEGKIQENYDNYLKETLMVGFMSTFPVARVIDEITIKSTCRRYDVEFKVKYVRLAMEEGGKEICDGIVTDKVEINHHLPMNGFGSHCYIDEAKTMEEAVIEMAKKHDLMICNKICSWPFAKAAVQKNHYKD